MSNGELIFGREAREHPKEPQSEPKPTRSSIQANSPNPEPRMDPGGNGVTEKESSAKC
jgi:hypothetical protein